MDLYLATEDALGEAIGDRLIEEVGSNLNVVVRMGGKGNTYLRQKLPELIKLASSYPVFLLTDLDRIECPPVLIQQWTGNRALPVSMYFRVAVREVESWLMADREGFSEFSGVPLNRLPVYPETIEDPKALLLGLIKRYGHKAIKQELLPSAGSKANVGFGYNQLLCQFVRDQWSPARASGASLSLDKTRNRLTHLYLTASRSI